MPRWQQGLNSGHLLKLPLAVFHEYLPVHSSNFGLHYLGHNLLMIQCQFLYFLEKIFYQIITLRLNVALLCEPL